jgi:hypothetical protein
LKLLDGGSENFECEAKQTNFLKIEKSWHGDQQK